MNTWCRILLACLVAALLAGCTSQTDEAEQSLRQKIMTDSEGCMALVSFKKTDGQALETDGVKGYKLTYEAQIQMQRSGIWLRGLDETSFRFSTNQPDAGSWNAFGNTMQNGLAVRVDQIVKVTGTLTGEKSENGWQFHISEQHYIKDPFLNP
jgi:uncharacterized surface anchored protein